jgi:hypothetical protein
MSCCENGNEFSGSIKGREFLDYLAAVVFSRKMLLHEGNYWWR